jgi:hypothetical protein
MEAAFAKRLLHTPQQCAAHFSTTDESEFQHAATVRRR